MVTHRNRIASAHRVEAMDEALDQDLQRIHEDRFGGTGNGRGAMKTKRVLLTGGSRGLGLLLCRRLLEEGWHVLNASRSSSAALKGLGEKYAGRLQHFATDFSDVAAVARLVAEADLRSGVQAFVANAAVGTEGLLALTSATAIEECLRVNLTAPIQLAREVVKGMLATGGCLVFVSSVAARVGLSGLSVYGACKGGLLSFSRAIAREYGERGIRSNAVVPGFFESDMSASLSESDRERLRRRTALKRLGRADEVVGAVLFLLGDEAGYVTGTEIVVDGGATC